jgi:voltage-gated sodium channel
VTTTPVERPIPRVSALARIVDAHWFQLFISGVIVANAIVLGAETYLDPGTPAFDTLMLVNEAFYLVFLTELILRIASYGRQPWNFFRSGWNVFDFIVIGAALIPALRAQAEVIRLLRLARIVRLLRFLPDARVLVATMGKAIPPVFSMIVLVVLILFIYGMIGVIVFGEALPDEWGTIGSAMMTLFILLTLENFPTYLEQAQEVTPFATVFFLSYVLIAAFVVLNLVLGIVIGSMEEAREEERQREHAEAEQEHASLLEAIEGMRSQLDHVERQLRRSGRSPGAGP